MIIRPYEQKGKKIVFNNQVFTDKPKYFSDFDPGPAGKGTRRLLNLERRLLLPDIWETYLHIKDVFRIDWTKTVDARVLDLIRQTILDESFPGLIYTEDGGNIAQNTFGFGRLQLIKVLGDRCYTPAIPELREVFLHDLDQLLRTEAIDSLLKIDENLGLSIIYEGISNILNYGDNLGMLRGLMTRLYDHPSSDSIPVLKKLYDRSLYEFPTNKEEEEDLNLGYRMINYTLQALGKIPSTESLKIIEHALEFGSRKESYEGLIVEEGLTRWYRKKIKKFASVALSDWIKSVEKNEGRVLSDEDALPAENIIKRLRDKYEIPSKTFSGYVLF